MNIKFNRKYGQATEEIETASLTVTRDELATIYFALGEYKKSLLNTVNEVHGALNKPADPNTLHIPSGGLEDELFCYAEAAKCAALEFHIKYDYNSDEIQEVTKWLDI